MRKFYLSMAALCCAAVMNAEIPASGKVGTCDYVFDSASGLLTITSSDDAPEWGGELEIDNPLHSPFAGSELLKEVVIEEGVDAIGTGAFLRCMNLEKITFASTVGSIGFSSDPWQEPAQNYLPFLGCKNLKTLIFKSHYAPDYDNSIDFKKPSEAFDFDPSKVNLYVYDGSVSYFMESGWGVFNICTLPAVASGTFDKGFAWNLSGNGKLTITGEGAMPDFTLDQNPWPWKDYIQDIKEAVVSEGIVVLGGGTFGMHGNLEKVYLPATLTSIGASAFAFTPKLTEIVCAAIYVPLLGEYALPTMDNNPRYVYVWKYLVEDYQNNAAWGVHEINAFSSQMRYIDADVQASAETDSETSLYINWLKVNGATNYLITLTAEDGSFSIEIRVNAEGQVISYVRKAGKGARYVVNEMAEGWRLLINGLESGVKYNITILAKDNTHTLATFHASTSTAQESSPEGIYNVQSYKGQCTKVLRDGQLLIEKNGKIYNAQGAVIIAQ